MKSTIAMLLFVVAWACMAAPAAAAELKVGANDTVQAVLAAQKGSRVTVRVRSGQEITGTVREVGSRVVQLGAVSGKDFFDAVIPLEAVDAVFVRVKE
jgi:ABC-type transporter MlaC component